MGESRPPTLLVRLLTRSDCGQRRCRAPSGSLDVSNGAPGRKSPALLSQEPAGLFHYGRRTMDWQPIKTAPPRARVLICDYAERIQIGRSTGLRWFDDL